MCGRFGLTDPLELQRAGGLFQLVHPDVVSDDAVALMTPRFNIAPTRKVLAARIRVRDRDTTTASQECRIDALRWGLVPTWAKDTKIGGALANARAESLANKPSFRGAWAAARRCAIFADVFYEWQDVGDATADPRNGDDGTTGRRPVARRATSTKQPHAIRMTDDAPFAIGGLWESWRNRAVDPDAPDALLTSCTVITTSPNTLLARLHDRMPVIIPPSSIAAWLDPTTSGDTVQALLAPYPTERMRAYPISRFVNAPSHDDASVIAPLPSRLS